MPDHTPGPWMADGTQVRKVSEEKDYKSFKNNYLLAEMKGPVWEEKKKANAQLMAAAPNLLEAVELSLDFFKNCRQDICGREYHIEVMEKAIKKAKGDGEN